MALTKNQAHISLSFVKFNDKKNYTYTDGNEDNGKTTNENNVKPENSYKQAKDRNRRSVDKSLENMLEMNKIPPNVNAKTRKTIHEVIKRCSTCQMKINS